MHEQNLQNKILILLNILKNTKKLEGLRVPPGFDFSKIPNLSAEAREKLSKIQPETLAQAIRIDGVRQSDIAMLSFSLLKKQ